MGQESDQALKSIETTRAALERDIDELFRRLPEPAVLAARAKTLGAVAGGAAVTVGAAVARQKKQAALKRRRMEARVNAEELARAFSPHPPAEPAPRSRLPLVAVLAAVLGVATALVVRGRGNGNE